MRAGQGKAHVKNKKNRKKKRTIALIKKGSGTTGRATIFSSLGSGIYNEQVIVLLVHAIPQLHSNQCRKPIGCVAKISQEACDSSSSSSRFILRMKTA